jgi:RimJ/RimL family protein N-acetyltransferase
VSRDITSAGARPPQDVSLVGDHVRIEPLGPGHARDLADELGTDDDVWRWLVDPPGDEVGMRAFVAGALADRANGERFPFAIVEQSTGRAVGSSSYLDIVPEHRRIEIGWTFYARRVWRSAVNTESKLLLLGHAFDDLGYERVALKTHHRNERSQAAIARLGATREGVLRHHMVDRYGGWRDSVYYSILSDEWPRVRDRLRADLTRH